MTLANATIHDQDAKGGLIGRRVSVEVGGVKRAGRVKSLAGSTMGGAGIYLVWVDGGGVLPFAADQLTVEIAAGDWGLAYDD